MSSVYLADSAGFYTRAIADVSDSFGRLRGELGIIHKIGRTVFPADWMPWLLENVGMGAVIPHVQEAGWLNVYQQRSWVYYRGTATAHETALGWIGFDATYRDGPVGTPIYDHYDLVLDRYPLHADLPAVIGLSQASKATASIFHRVIFGHDVPAVRAAHTTRGSALWGRFSGVEWRAGWPKLSLRATVGGRLVGSADVGSGAGVLALINTRTGPERHIRFAHSRRGFDRPAARRLASVTVMISAAGHIQDAPWSRLPWSDAAHGSRPAAYGAAADHVPVVVPVGTDETPIRFAHARRALDSMQESP